MKIRPAFSLVAALVISLSIQAQDKSLKSGIYHLGEAKAIKPMQEQLLKGSSTMLTDLEIIVQSLLPGKKTDPVSYGDMEEMVIIDNGQLKINIGSQSKVVGRGSVALAVTGDKHSFENVSSSPATFYLLKFKSKSAPAANRTEKSQGSFIVDWDETTFKEHERGGRRDIFDRATNLFARFEMHVTTLNPGLSSHDPHKHNAEEIILLRVGAAEMLIAGENMPMGTGDVAFLDSQVFHGITKGGEGLREYYAFQWEVTK